MTKERNMTVGIMRFFTLFTFLFLLSAFPVLADEAEDVPVTETDVESPKPLPMVRVDAGLAKAEAQLSEGKYMQAIATLKGVLARHPADADVQAAMGYAWQKLGDTDTAVEYIDRALSYDPKHLGANKIRAELYLEAGEFRRALEQMQVMNMVCGTGDCAELDALQVKMNAFKKGRSSKQPPEKEPTDDDNVTQE